MGIKGARAGLDFLNFHDMKYIENFFLWFGLQFELMDLRS
jgi:hypothetical protein